MTVSFLAINNSMKPSCLDQQGRQTHREAPSGVDAAASILLKQEVLGRAL